jgi:alpha-mannosidase/mannosylglycerate hydrolase
MPQLYAGFELRDCVLGRGTNESTTPPFFTWKAPDGSCVFTFKLQDYMGYGSLARTRTLLEGPTPSEADEAEARQSLERYIRRDLERGCRDVLCLVDSIDHTEPTRQLECYFGLIREAAPGTEVTHSTLPAFFREAREATGEVPERTGELTEPSKDTGNPYLWLIPFCISGRTRIKLANSEACARLQRWAEPFAAFSALAGKPLAPGLLRTAWDTLLLNHAHDSICGCSIDQVHRDMMNRFDQVRIQADQIKHHALSRLMADCREPATDEDPFSVTLVNPLPIARREVVTFPVDLPDDYPHAFEEGFNLEPTLGGDTRIKAFKLVDLATRSLTSASRSSAGRSSAPKSPDPHCFPAAAVRATRWRPRSICPPAASPPSWSSRLTSRCAGSGRCGPGPWPPKTSTSAFASSRMAA